MIPRNAQGAPRPESRTTWRRLALIVVALGVLAAAGAGAWYLFLRPAAPAAVALGSSPSTGPSDAAAETPTPAASAGSTPEAAPVGAADGLAGPWTVDGSVGSFDDFSGSFVGYRVREELAGIGAAEAVGRTPDVSGTLVVEGTTVTAAEIEADLTTLRSDNSMRDGQLGRQGLETDTYPAATFVLTEPIELGALPAEGEAFTAAAIGDLTLHGQTRSVEVELEGRLSGGVVTVVGSLPIFFGDYGIPTPESMRVLSIDENGTMEFQLHFAKA